jgi:hypothetical protein
MSRRRREFSAMPFHIRALLGKKKAAPRGRLSVAAEGLN